jgi:hypothetical protein
MPITPTLDELGHKTYTGHFIQNEDTRFLDKWILKDPSDKSSIDLDKVQIAKDWLFANRIEASFNLLLDAEEMELERKQFIEFIKTLN